MPTVRASMPYSGVRSGPGRGVRRTIRQGQTSYVNSNQLIYGEFAIQLNDSDYHGDDAEYLRLQALQLLLRYQFQALRKLWDLPDVFEVRVHPSSLLRSGSPLPGS